MKKFTLACGVFLLAAVFLMGITPASATTLTFGDNNSYWPTWGTPGDADYIGGPNIIGGRATVDDSTGFLTSVEFDTTAETGFLGGDLFIDLGSDTNWDYVIRAATGIQYEVVPFSATITATGSYVLSHINGGRTVQNGFMNHPYAAVQSVFDNAVSSIGGLAYREFDSDDSDGLDPLLFGTSIDLAGFDDFTIGFAVAKCSNDVIYENISIPEPATMLLVGSCLLGLAVIRRRKFLK